MAECVENKGRFLDDIVNGIMAICEESGWQLPAHNNNYSIPDITNPVMDLFSCETGAQMAMAGYLLADQLNDINPFIVKRINYEIKQRCLIPYLNGTFGWMGGPNITVNNWTPWCTQNTLIALFSLEDLDKESKKKILLKASKSLNYFLDEYGDDGCCSEGASYYRAAGLCLFNAIEVLNAVTQNNFSSLYKDIKIKNIAPYIMNVHINDTYYANFADCSTKAGRSGVREYLYAKRTENKDMMIFAAQDHRKNEHYLLPRSENLFYHLQAAFTEEEISTVDINSTVIKKDIYYESVGLLIARDSRNFLAVKAGCNDDSHNHNDTGSIILYRDGKPILIDIGVETYSRKTFSPQRYDIWTMQSGYHNIITFGGIMQEAGAEYKATVLETVLEEDKASITMELKSCYPQGTIGSYQRKVTFIKNKEIRITDTLSELPKNSYLSLMTLDKPEVKNQIMTFENHNDCCIQLQGDYIEEVEEIALSDPKLIGEWGSKVYRTKINLNNTQIELIIN